MREMGARHNAPHPWAYVNFVTAHWNTVVGLNYISAIIIIIIIIHSEYQNIKRKHLTKSTIFKHLRWQDSIKGISFGQTLSRGLLTHRLRKAIFLREKSTFSSVSRHPIKAIPVSSHRAQSSHALQITKVCDCQVIKGTVLVEQRNFTSLSRLPIEGCYWKFTLLTQHACAIKSA